MSFSGCSPPPPPPLIAKKCFASVDRTLHCSPQLKTEEHTSKSSLQHTGLPCKSAPKDTVTTSWKPRNTRTVIFIAGWMRDRRRVARTVNARTLITLTGWALKPSQLPLAQRETRKLGNQYRTSASRSATLGGRGNDMSLGFQLWPSFPGEIWTLPSGVSLFELNSLMGKVVEGCFFQLCFCALCIFVRLQRAADLSYVTAIQLLLSLTGKHGFDCCSASFKVMAS